MQVQAGAGGMVRAAWCRRWLGPALLARTGCDGSGEVRSQAAGCLRSGECGERQVGRRSAAAVREQHMWRRRGKAARRGLREKIRVVKSTGAGPAHAGAPSFDTHE